MVLTKLTTDKEDCINSSGATWNIAICKCTHTHTHTHATNNNKNLGKYTHHTQRKARQVLFFYLLSLVFFFLKQCIQKPFCLNFCILMCTRKYSLSTVFQSSWPAWWAPAFLAQSRGVQTDQRGRSGCSGPWVSVAVAMLAMRTSDAARNAHLFVNFTRQMFAWEWHLLLFVFSSPFEGKFFKK